MMPDLWGPPSDAEISAAENENARLSKRVKELETQNAELSGKIGQLEAERDAAVNDLHYLVNHPLSAGPCYACLHSKDCWRGGDCDPVNDDRWQWRGICKEGH